MNKQDFKKKVLDWIAENGVDISDRPVKVFKYRGEWEVRVYNQPMEIPNNKSSFRRTDAIKDEKGNITGWNGTRGVHSTKIATYTHVNETDFNLPEEKSFILEILKS